MTQCPRRIDVKNRHLLLQLPVLTSAVSALAGEAATSDRRRVAGDPIHPSCQIRRVKQRATLRTELPYLRRRRPAVVACGAVLCDARVPALEPPEPLDQQLGAALEKFCGSRKHARPLRHSDLLLRQDVTFVEISAHQMQGDANASHPAKLGVKDRVSAPKLRQKRRMDIDAAQAW